MLLKVNALTQTTQDGTRDLFRDLEVSVSRGERVAIVGANGCGKSTLLRTLAATKRSRRGEVWMMKEARVGWLQQMFEGDGQQRAMDAVFSGESEQMRAVRRYRAALSASSSTSASEMEAAVSDMEKCGAWKIESEASEMLYELGCASFLEQNMSTLSGGELKRVMLASTLLAEPDVLLLDEPTNHLSLEGVQWLEQYLTTKRRDTALVFVSHDRYFIDAVSTGILELDGQGGWFYHAGDYQSYLRGREERLYALMRDRAKARNTLRRESEWMRRQPKAREAKSKAREQAYYELKDRAAEQNEFATTMNLENQIAFQRLGTRVVELKGVSLTMGQQQHVLTNWTYTFERATVYGLVGENGVGKTSLCRALLGEIRVQSGEIVIGETVHFSHFMQDADFSDVSQMKAIDWIRDNAARADHLDSVHTLVDRFSFSGERQHTAIENLSGGEKRRLQLLGVLASAPNFLILDEPTNDLDLQTVTTFEEVVRDFPGTVVVISHDRAFMDGMCDVFLCLEGNGQVSEWRGTHYMELRERQAAKREEKQQRETSAMRTGMPLSLSAPLQVSTPESALDKEGRKALQAARRETKRIESNIEKTEAQMAELDESLLEAGSDIQLAMEIQQERAKLETKLEDLYERYEEQDGIIETLLSSTSNASTV